MLIMPPGHAREVAARRPFTRRDRRFLVIGSTVVVALVLAVIVAIGSSSPKSGRGCVYVTITSSTGALTIQGCGARARTICAEASVPGTYTADALTSVIGECRKAGLPARRPA
ncbi:MAG: hypothetical protein ACYDHH_05615 [Solirubrobacteraceae bacterium]